MVVRLSHPPVSYLTLSMEAIKDDQHHPRSHRIHEHEVETRIGFSTKRYENWLDKGVAVLPTLRGSVGTAPARMISISTTTDPSLVSPLSARPPHRGGELSGGR